MSRPAAVRAAVLGTDRQALRPAAPLGQAPTYGKLPGSPPKHFIISPRPHERQVNSLWPEAADPALGRTQGRRSRGVASKAVV